MKKCLAPTWKAFVDDKIEVTQNMRFDFHKIKKC